MADSVILCISQNLTDGFKCQSFEGGDIELINILCIT